MVQYVQGSTRIIARLDVKGPNLVKGVQLEGLRKLGDPNVFAQRYYEQGIDEILYIDIVASLYERNSLLGIVEQTTKDVFIPITVAGGIRSIEDVRQALASGADKVAVNTAAIRNPQLIEEVAQTFGSQCMVLSIEAKRISDEKWEAFCDNGREHTGIDAITWALQGAALGAGEILLTSVDRDGTGHGYDLDLIQKISDQVPIPVIASGGMGSTQHCVDVVRQGRADAIAIGSALHYERSTISDICDALASKGVAIRPRQDNRGEMR